MRACLARSLSINFSGYGTYSLDLNMRSETHSARAAGATHSSDESLGSWLAKQTRTQFQVLRVPLSQKPKRDVASTDPPVRCGVQSRYARHGPLRRPSGCGRECGNGEGSAPIELVDLFAYIPSSPSKAGGFIPTCVEDRLDVGLTCWTGNKVTRNMGTDV